MAHWIAILWKAVFTIGTVAAALYYIISIWIAIRFHAEQSRELSAPASSFTPPVSILKPLKGTDPEMYENLSSHCALDYPQYEILLGVSDVNDPALAVVQKLQTAFPRKEISVMICREKLGSNIKVSNLAQMLPQARYEHVIVNDSDIRVDPDYLRNVIAPLAAPTTGLVTCLYRGIAAPTLGSWLECLGISTDFAAGVLTSRSLERGVRFGLGSTLAFRRNDLKSVGGFEGFVDYLADDYQIGSRLAAAGKQVELSKMVVQTSLPAYSLRGFWDHQLRWGRTIRDSRRSGYLGLVFTFGLLWAILAVLSARGESWAWGLLAGTVALRIAQAVVVGRLCLADRQVIRFLPLLPLRDLIAAGVWFVSLFGHTIRWRGDTFQLIDGKLVKLPS